MLFFMLFDCPTANFGPLWSGQPLSPYVNHCFFVDFWPEGHREPRNEVEFLSPAERLAGIEPETVRLLRNALTH